MPVGNWRTVSGMSYTVARVGLRRTASPRVMRSPDSQSGAQYCQPYCQPFRVLPAVVRPVGTWLECRSTQ